MENKNKKTWQILGIIVGGIVLLKLVGTYRKKQGRNETPSGGGVIIPNISAEELLRLQRMANQLYDAMNNCGTDNEAIANVVSQVRDEQDWRNLIKAYGIRTLTSQWWCVGVSDFTGDLPTSIKSEVSSSTIQNINDILTTKGISTTL